ncbi:MAG: double-strand break repair helicase AddA, partial [Rhodobacterales bacterium CG18_big_fil_WC_8_21_14_2_50_71_9]
AVRAGDIMVLVRRRDILAAELVRALKRHGVDVAGADRLKIGEDLAVRDLLALARFALTPGDDLTLAALLRSPLCGLSGAALEALAAPRAATLWAALRADPAHRTVAARLEAAMAAADFLRPYEFFERALTQEGGRQRLLARLGVEAEDAIDELLAQALAYEDDSAPTLEGFLDWIGRGEIEIKREMDKGAGAVRVMTVHGAKGLEAPVVILPDCAAGKAGRTRAIARLGSPDAPFAAWTMPKDATPPPLTEAAEQAARAARDESRRLLYVAMTRAERWLVVCAAGDPEAKAQAESWHALVRAGMQDAAAVEIDPPEGLTGRALRVQDFGAMAGEGAAADAAGAPPAAPPTASAPHWLFAPAPPPPSALIRRTAASALGEDGAGDDAAPTGGGRDAEMARLRGLAIHALLEHLPGAAPEARPALAARLLARLAPGMDAAALLAEAEAAMALPQAAAVFAPDALAEAALSLTLPSGLR